MNTNKEIYEAFQAGRRAALNEQMGGGASMQRMPMTGMGTPVPQTGGGLGGGGNQYPSMMSNNSGTAVPNYKSGRGPDGTVLLPDGTVVYPDGTVVLPDGTVV